MKKGRFIIISGPSGVGKGTICNVLLKDSNIWISTSMTTREPRGTEKNGVEYFFVIVTNVVAIVSGVSARH